MSMTIIVLLVVALYTLQIFLQVFSRFGLDMRASMGNRDNSKNISVIAGRIERAKNNMLETLPVFIALALLTIIKDENSNMAMIGALVFLIARIIYVPAYISGIPVIRSLIWMAGIGGLMIMAIPLVKF